MQFQLVDPGQVNTKMTESFAGKLTWSVPTPSTFVKSAIRTIGVNSNTCGYWPHGFQDWFLQVLLKPLLPQCVMSRAMLMEGKKQYKHAMKMKKDHERNYG